LQIGSKLMGLELRGGSFAASEVLAISWFAISQVDEEEQEQKLGIYKCSSWSHFMKCKYVGSTNSETTNVGVRQYSKIMFI